MKLTKQWRMLSFWICISLFVQSSGRAQVSKADSLFYEGNYLEARVEYERMIYFDRKIFTHNEILLKKSYCYKAANEFANALETLQQADFYVGSDSLRFQLYHEAILNAYLSERHDIALSLLSEMNYNLNGATNNTIEILEILVLNEQMRWHDAKEKYIQFSEKYKLKLDTAVYESIIDRKFRNPEKAIKISYFIPGGGQVYSGAPLKGLMSAGLQGASVALAISGVRNGYFFSSTLSGVALFYLLYNGGAQYAGELANRRNQKFLHDFKSQIKQSLQKDL